MSISIFSCHNSSLRLLTCFFVNQYYFNSITYQKIKLIKTLTQNIKKLTSTER